MLEDFFGGHNPKKTSKYRNLSEELKNRVEDKEIEGWEVLEVKNERVVLGKNKKGGILKHGVLFFFTGWLTAGLGNVAYHEHKKRDMEKIVLREEKSNNDSSTVENLESLQELKDNGSISDKEFDQLKAEILDDTDGSRKKYSDSKWGKGNETKKSKPGWTMKSGENFMHRKIDENSIGDILEIGDGNRTGEFLIQDGDINAETAELEEKHGKKWVNDAKTYLKEYVV